MKLMVQPSEASGGKVLTDAGVEFIAFDGDLAALWGRG
jgi:hypothetical protein